jgi:hypothetical protein
MQVEVKIAVKLAGKVGLDVGIKLGVIVGALLGKYGFEDRSGVWTGASGGGSEYCRNTEVSTSVSLHSHQ